MSAENLVDLDALVAVEHAAPAQPSLVAEARRWRKREAALRARLPVWRTLAARRDGRDILACVAEVEGILRDDPLFLDDARDGESAPSPSGTVCRYNMTLRPFSFATVPRGFLHADDLQTRAGYYGRIYYSRKIGADDCARYGFTDETTLTLDEAPPAVAEQVARERRGG